MPLKTLAVIMVLFAPAMALAQSAGEIGRLLNIVLDILNVLAAVIVAIAVLYFLWGLAQYVLNASGSGLQDEGRSKMLYGILAIFVMVSLWGLVNVVQGTFDIEGEQAKRPSEVEVESRSSGSSSFPRTIEI